MSKKVNVFDKKRGLWIEVKTNKGGTGKTMLSQNLTPLGFLYVNVDPTGTKNTKRFNDKIIPKYSDRYEEAVDLDKKVYTALKKDKFDTCNIVFDTQGAETSGLKELESRIDVTIYMMQPTQEAIATTLSSIVKDNLPLDRKVIFIFSQTITGNKEEKFWMDEAKKHIKKTIPKHKVHYMEFPFSKVWRERVNRNELLMEKAYPNGFDKPMLGAYKSHVGFLKKLDKLMRG